MRKILFFICLIISGIVSAQNTWTSVAGKSRFTNGIAFGCKDSSAYIYGADTVFMYASCTDSSMYVKFKGYYRKIAYDAPGGYLKITDTLAMLSNLLRKTDTASMLSNRLKISDTANMLSGYSKTGRSVQYADTSSMLTGYAKSGRSVQYSDTASMLSNRLKISDTATMLSPYARTSNLNFIQNQISAPQTANSYISGNQAINGGGLIVRGVLNSSTIPFTIARNDMQASFQNPGTGHAGIDIFQTTTPTGSFNAGEATVNMQGVLSNGSQQQLGSYSASWAKVAPSNYQSVMRIHANSNTNSNVDFRLFGGGGIVLFGTNDSTAAGNNILLNRGQLQVLNRSDLAFTRVVPLMDAPSVGRGVEIYFDSSATSMKGVVQAYNRSSSLFDTLNIAGSPINLTGNTFLNSSYLKIKPGTTSALQINGRTTDNLGIVQFNDKYSQERAELQVSNQFKFYTGDTPALSTTVDSTGITVQKLATIGGSQAGLPLFIKGRASDDINGFMFQSHLGVEQAEMQSNSSNQFLFYTGSTPTLRATVDANGVTSAAGFIKTGGTSSQFLKADGSVDANTYLTANQAITVTATGDATGTSTSSPTAPSLPLVLATVNTNTGSWGTASSVPQFTVNGKGLVTAAANQAIQIAESQVTGLTTDLSAKLNLAGGTMTGSLILNADPTVPLGAVTKNYVDNIATGLSWKPQAKAATTANITLSGTQTIDGISVVAGDTVFVKNQTTTSQNGYYIASAGAWARASWGTTGAQVLGSSVFVRNGGTINGGTQWANSNTVAPTIGTDPVTFTQIAGAGVYAAGTGITLTGNLFSIDNTVATLTGTQTLTNKTIAASSNTITGLTNANLSGTAGITNANLANSSITLNGTAISLGGSKTLTLNSADFANQGGSINYVLHGNPSGNPTFGAVNLASDVAGLLPIANGGTGSSTQNFVDLTTNQNVSGIKTFNGTTGGAYITIDATSRSVSGKSWYIGESQSFGTFDIFNSTNATRAFSIGSTGNVVAAGNVTGSSIIKSGGTSSQFLKANGSVDSTAYMPTSGGTLTNYATQAGSFTSGATIDNTSQFWTNTSTGAITVTLPTTAGNNKIYTIRYGAVAGGGNTLTVGTTSSQNIINHTTTATTYVMAAGDVITVQSDGTSWIITAKN